MRSPPHHRPSRKNLRLAGAFVGILVVLGLVGGAYAIANDEPTIAEIFAEEANEESKDEIAAENALLQKLGEADPRATR
jgi:hypothetical protein